MLFTNRFFAKHLTQSVLGAVMMCLLGCSDDESVNRNQHCNLQDETCDVVRNSFLHEINSDEAAPQRFEINTLDDIRVEAEGRSAIDVRTVKEGDKQYIEISVKPEYKGKCFVESVLVSPVNAPRDGRHLFVSAQPGNAQYKSSTDSGDPMFSVYSEYIGKGTFCFGKLGNERSTVLDYKKISNLSRDYVIVNTTKPQYEMVERNEQDAGSMMETYSVNLGVDFKKTRRINVGYDVIGGGSSPVTKIIPKKESAGSISGTVNFGMSETVKTSYDYEYYFNVYNVTKAEVALKMDMFELSTNRQYPDTTLFILISKQFVKDLVLPSPETFSATEFFNSWGTDVITQGSFGGYCLYYYGRKENAYEHSLGIDASAQMKVSKPASDGKSWVDMYLNKNSPHVSASVDASYKSEEYNWASSQQTNYICEGGNMTDNDAAAWLQAFNSDEDSEKWALKGYRVAASDALKTDESDWNLYPIELMARNLLDIFVSRHRNSMTHADSVFVDRMSQNIASLCEAKIPYIEANIDKDFSQRTRIVVADFMMKNGKNGHKSGEPKSFVDKDPRNPNKYLIYYPVMANKFNYYKSDLGYALETTQNAYYNAAADDEDHYWYYALAHEDDCDGIVDIKFESNVPDFWVRRGDCSDCGGLIITDNYVIVRFFDPGIHQPSDKITAIGLYSKHDGTFDPCRVVGSTGGSELSPYATETEYNTWYNFWQSGSYIKTQWNEGSFTSNEKLWPCVSRQTLDYNHFKGAGVCHPKPW